MTWLVWRRLAARWASRGKMTCWWCAVMPGDWSWVPCAVSALDRRRRLIDTLAARFDPVYMFSELGGCRANACTHLQVACVEGPFPHADG